MSQATALLGLITETSMHAGAGTSVGAVDLPIQREGHNGWPCVFGSAVKGALRDRAEQSVLTDDDLFVVFGPDTKNASDHAGALSVGDARLLLLPVRSLTTAYRWVTCPEAIRRLKRDAERLAVQDLSGLDTPSVEDTADACTALAIEGAGDLFLEEYRFTIQASPQLANLAEAIAKLIQREQIVDDLKRRLVLVSDDLFAHLVQAATPVNAHIALETATKTVADGALWYEETLPPETVLYIPLMATRARKQGSALSAAEVLDKVTALFAKHHWLQLGGNETVGMGWCAVSALAGRK